MFAGEVEAHTHENGGSCRNNPQSTEFPIFGLGGS